MNRLTDDLTIARDSETVNQQSQIIWFQDISPFQKIYVTLLSIIDAEPWWWIFPLAIVQVFYRYLYSSRYLYLFCIYSVCGSCLHLVIFHCNKSSQAGKFPVPDRCLDVRESPQSAIINSSKFRQVVITVPLDMVLVSPQIGINALDSTSVLAPCGGFTQNRTSLNPHEQFCQNLRHPSSPLPTVRTVQR